MALRLEQALDFLKSRVCWSSYAFLQGPALRVYGDGIGRSSRLFPSQVSPRKLLIGPKP